MKNKLFILMLAAAVLGTVTGCRNTETQESKEAVTAAETSAGTESGEAGTGESAAPASRVADASEMAEAQEVVEEGMVPVGADQLVDGVYPVTVSSSSSMFNIESAELTVQNGEMTALMTMGGKGYLYVYMGSGQEAAAADQKDYIPFEETKEGLHTFTVPVEALDQGIDCAAFSKKKEKWYERTLVFRADSLPAFAFTEDALTTAEDLGLEKGSYLAEAVLQGGSGKASIESPALFTISDTGSILRVVWSSPNYDYMIVEGEKYLPVSTEGNSVFEIPFTVFDRPVKVLADTTAMSQPYEIEYTITLNSSTLEKTE